jgi:transcriptional regulator with XRE-family HTH domain
MSLGRRIRLLRQRRGWTQHQLRAASGVRQQLISELETGRKRTTQADLLDKLAQALGVTIDQLLHGGGIDPAETEERELVAAGTA